MASWEELARNFLLEEEEEDEELFFILLPAVMPFLDEEKTPEHTSSLPGAKKVKEILEGHENWCKEEFRMEAEIFRAIANFLRAENLLRDTRGMKIEEQLGLFMFMLSHNASTERLKKEFQHSGETVHRKIYDVFNIIPTLTQKFIRLLNPSHTHMKITCDPRFMPFFQNCIGAIDGTHVPITIGQDKASPYRNRKGTLSQNVMFACDFDLKFTFISSGWEGSASDAGVLRSALGKGFTVPAGKFYLVDGGYANTPSFLAPYRGVKYHLSEFRRRGQRGNAYANYKELFNHRHAILRNHIERAFGVLKKRFPILKVGTHYPIETQVMIPAAAAVFHNIIRGLNGSEEWLDILPDNINPSNYVDMPEGDTNYPSEMESNHGNTLRDQIAHQMWAAYNV
ncbi:uncharacterized protein [Miscanthus floridulus]|uniref:uncharacterized protein n=1 Tax=Miscanthus floridulus TaxID=154761 RepID=UPI00345AD691